MIGPVVCGAHAIVYVNGRPYARVSTFSVQSAEPQREVAVVDTLDIAEEIPGAITRRVSMSVYRLHGDGGAEGGGLAVPQRDAVVQKYFSVLVADRVNDLTMFRADRCKLTAQAWTVGRGMVTGTLQVNVLDLSNEVAAAT